MKYHDPKNVSEGMSIAIAKCLNFKDWGNSILYSESNAENYSVGMASVLASKLSGISDIPDRGEVLKAQSETLFVDETRKEKYIVTLRKYHYAQTMTIKRSKYER